VLKPTPTRLAQTFSERSEDPLVFSLLHCHQGAPRVWRAPIRQADRVQPHALAEAVRTRILAWLSEERFADCSVQQTLWRVIDEVCYVASLRTWYRVAARHRLCGDRRRHPSRPATVIPQLCAAGPNQVWSWDIARVKIKVHKTPLHPYLIEDVFSRKCVGWRLEEREHDRLAADLIQTAVNSEGANPHTLHADGGPSMTSHEGRCYCSGWASTDPTPGRTCRTTTRFRNRCSKRSNTMWTTRSFSTITITPAPGSRCSWPFTTVSIDTPDWPDSPRTAFMTATGL
jgi:hypothetical protein